MFAKKNISLKSYNTFGIDARAQFLLEIESDEQLSEAYQSSQFKVIAQISIRRRLQCIVHKESAEGDP